MSVNIMIVDDEEGIRKSLSSYLKLEDYNVDTAENGKEALEKLRKTKYNIVLMDINMPVMDGLEALKEIKRIDFSIQVIMMTAYSTFDKTIKSLEFGATDYVMKPFKDLSEILHLINLSEERLDRWKSSMSASIVRQKGDRGDD